MPTSVTMPALGESVTEGTVTQWLKQEGDTVEADEPLLEVSTDKVDTEVPSPVSGVLLKIVAAEDDEIEVGGELAVIGEAGEAPSAPAAPAEPEAAPAPAAEEAPAPAAESAPAEAPVAAEGVEVPLPELGESVTEGTVTQWLKAVGDTVEADEPLLEVSTDKVDTEIPSPAAGTLLEIRVPEDETADVGAVLAVIGSGAAPAAAPAPEAPKAPEAPAAPAEPAAAPAAPAPAPSAPAAAPAAPAAPAEKPTASSYITPIIRKFAAENNVDLAEVQGTGVGGRIRRQDVEAVVEARKAAAPAASSAPAAAPAAPVEPSPLRGRTEKASRLRLVAAKALHESLQSMAQLTTVVEVDVTKVMRLRSAKKDEFFARHGVKLSPLPFFALAAIEALRQYPVINASLNMEEKTITYPEAENVGFAVDTPKGLIVPVVKDAGDLNIPGLAKHIAELAGKARDGGLGPDDLSGGTFTITNTGSVGALFDTPIVPLGQSAILGTAAIVKRPVFVDDPELGEVVAARQIMNLTLSYDHRLIDGADAARYLQTVKKRVEEGNFEGALGL